MESNGTRPSSTLTIFNSSSTPECCVIKTPMGNGEMLKKKENSDPLE